RHHGRSDCACDTCKETRTQCQGCTNPNKCYLKARQLLNSLEPKWNPLLPQPEDYEDIPALNANETLFDPTISVKGDLRDTFRIFTEGRRGGTEAPDTQMEPEEDEDEIIVYTDGSATNNGREDARAGSGAFYGAIDQQNLAIRVPEELKQSNNVAEILAVKETVESNPKGILLRIKSDSKLV
ncbi:hypothetical protein C8R47DRAFT_971760, partial [Mycena vitilis]